MTQSNVESEKFPPVCSIHRISAPLRHPWEADPVKDDYDNVWTEEEEEEGKSLNEFHLQKQTESTLRGEKRVTWQEEKQRPWFAC